MPRALFVSARGFLSFCPAAEKAFWAVFLSM